MTEREIRKEKVETCFCHLFLMIQKKLLEKSTLNVMCDCKICTSKPENTLILIFIFKFRG
jgi:hypothetical protein